ncbi:MAG: response regulator [Deltaproteobacteria bacterium]|nr:response regulator [Deltaproteobacteria bacterium]
MNDKFLKKVSFFFFVFLSIGVYLNQANSAVVIDGSKQSYTLESSLQIFIDEENKLDVQEVASGQHDALFKKVHEKAPNLSFNNHSVWFKFEVIHDIPQDQEWFLQVNYSLLNHLNLFYLDAEGKLQQTIVGMNYPYYSRPIDDYYYTLPLNLPANSKRTYYINVQSDFPYSLPFKISSEEVFRADSGFRNWVLTSYFSFITAMMLYNFFLFIAVKDRPYIYYVLFILTFAIFQLSVFGISVRIFPNAIWWNLHQRHIFGNLAPLFAMQFARSFFNSSQYLPRTDRYMKLGIYAFIAGIFLTVFISNYWGGFVLATSIMVFSVVLMIANIQRVWQGNKPARYFLLSWSIMVASSSVYQLWSFGLISYNILTIWIFLAGSSTEAILLSFALAYRINVLRQEKAETAQLATKAKAEAEAKSDFLAKMSHEIRTPMNGVLGMAQLLGATPLKPVQRNYTQIILSSGKILLNLINDILDHSKIEAGKMQLESIPFQVNTLVEECTTVVATTIENKDVVLRAYISPQTPPVLAGDPNRIRQIIVNLLSNAAKFTQEGSITLRVEPEINPENGNTEFVFSVKDTGIGISESDQKKLFTPFTQADSSITRRYGGSGLGLTISKQLVELMHGEIGVESENGKGSRFWFRLPLAASQLPGVSVLDTSPLKKIKILIAEEHSIASRDILENCFSWGMQCTVIHSSEECRQLFVDASNQKTFDIVLCSAEILQEDNFRLFRLFQDNLSLSHIPVLLLLKNNVTPDDRIFQLGNLYAAIEKPFTNFRLAKKLLQILRKEKEDFTLAKELLAEEEQVSLNQLHVVVVEDNIVNQMIIQGLLKNLGVYPKIIENGRKAIEEFKNSTQTIDLIFMDCEMPEMDGYTATAKIREIEKERGQSHVPIIALTAHALEEYRQKSFAAGMDDHLTKPIDYNKLKEKLLQWTEKKHKPKMVSNHSIVG